MYPIYQRQVRYKDYSADSLNQLPLDYEEVKQNIKKNFNHTNPIAYYKVIDVNNQVQRINPLNAYDVSRLKKIALANAQAKVNGKNGHGFQFADYSQTIFNNQKVADSRSYEFLAAIESKLWNAIGEKATKDWWKSFKIQPIIKIVGENEAPRFEDDLLTSKNHMPITNIAVSEMVEFETTTSNNPNPNAN